MSTVYWPLKPEEAQFLTDNFPEYRREIGSNFPVAALAFDGGSTDEDCFFQFTAISYGSGNLTARIIWYGDDQTSGDVKWGGALAAITPNNDSQDVQTKSFATATTVVDSHLGTTAQRLHAVDLTLSNLDSMAALDEMWFHFYRDASDTSNDTFADDALVTKIILSWSDT